MFPLNFYPPLLFSFFWLIGSWLAMSECFLWCRIVLVCVEAYHVVLCRMLWRNLGWQCLLVVLYRVLNHLPENYRPVSLSSVTCKILEHIICRHLLKHLEKNKILAHLNHGFRSGYSCGACLLFWRYSRCSHLSSLWVVLQYPKNIVAWFLVLALGALRIQNWIIIKPV
jgi:hypothetical protein